MLNRVSGVESLSGAALLAATRELVRRSHVLEAELLVHLGEIDERKLYLDSPFPSMFAFCVAEFGFSEAAAYDRIQVARAGRRLPSILDAATAGRVHLTGLRLLAPHLTEENHGRLLAEAAGKSKREIEEIVARLAPRPPVPATVRKVADRRIVFVSAHMRTPPSAGPGADPPAETPASDQLAAVRAIEQPRPAVAPLSADLFKIQFTATVEFRDKLREAQDLLRHRVPDGDLASIFGKALDVLIEKVKKERFAVGRKARRTAMKSGGASSSRHIPDSIKRAVYERDQGRCTFIDQRGRRCGARDALEFEHVEGFARTHSHTVEGIELRCRAHNQHAADQMYGREFMEKARARGKGGTTRAGTSSGPAPPKARR